MITIDGPAGAGKSTLGQLLADRLGYLYFDTGSMYRALAWAALHYHTDLADIGATTELARRLNIAILPPTVVDGRQYTVIVDGNDVTWNLRDGDVERTVSQAASSPPVREVMRSRQREIGERGRVVMVGRDIGSIVMPDAPIKIYLDATVDERAKRRAAELRARGVDAEEQQIRDEIVRRDALDRHVSSPADDAVIIVSDGLSPEQVADAVLSRVQKR